MNLAGQFLAHLVGDYLLQSHWMAVEKTKRTLPAAAHAVCYGLPFLALQPTPATLGVIVGSHFVIDRWRLARYVVWAKNLAGPRRYHGNLRTTGYPDDTPPWLAGWLLIIADNTIHVLVNAAAFSWAGHH